MNLISQNKGNKFGMRLFAMLVCFAMAISASFAQTINVKGTVSDAMGPTFGASILEKGTTNGTVSDIDGNFSLNVKPNATLVISFVGLQTQEVQVNGQSTINVVLQENEMLDEVVVVGYGTMRKKDLTGSVVQINPDKIADSNPGTVQDVLRGTAGLQIGYNADAKGGGSIQLRGQNSLYTSGSHNSPLIILDGMAFYGELSEINPDDIGQIDVLKDASSAAIYGAKAASGVIIITTKKGKQGKPVINVSANIAANKKAEFREVYDGAGYMKFREDWYKAQTYGKRADGTWGYYSTGSGVAEGFYSLESAGSKEEYAKRLLLGGNNSDRVLDQYLLGNEYDWYGETFRTGFNQDYNASISGATENVSYYLSAGYLSNEGAVKGNDYSTIRSNMKINAKITPWLEIGANVNFQNRTDGDIQVPLGTNYWDTNMLRNAPFAPIKDEKGNYIQYPMNYTPTNGGYNYGFERQYLDLDKGYTVLNTIINAKVTLPFGITYSFNMSPRLQWFHDLYFMSAELPNSVASNRGANRNDSRNFDWSLNNTITWDKTFDKHHFTATLVQEAEELKYWSTSVSARNIQPTDAMGFHYIDGANKEQSSFGSYDTHSSAAAYLGRLFYSYNDRYMLTGTYRRDGYSAFGQNNPWANFWSVGASWMFSEESFAENLDWLSTGKLRVSYGTNGNRSLSDTYLALSNLSLKGTMVYPTGGSNTVMQALEMTRLGNPNLEWEKTTAYNVGLDFGIFDNILTGSVEWYYKKTHDMIMAQRIPAFSGFSSITTNLGQVNNSGVEITLNSRNISTKNFEWTSSFGFSYNKNQIKHLYYDYDENGVEQNDITNGWYIGKPVGEIWTWKTDGIWQVNEADEAAKVNQKPGDPKVINYYTADDKSDGTPVYNDNDKVYQGTTAPPVYWNLRNDFKYKNWTASFSMYSYAGHKSIETTYLNNDNSGSMMTNGNNTYKKEYWTPENPSNKYARLDAASPVGATAYRLHNRSFLRLDNINIGYTVPQELTRKAAIDRLHITLGIKNLFTIDSWEYGDPETGGLSTRTFNLGVNFTL